MMDRRQFLRSVGTVTVAAAFTGCQSVLNPFIAKGASQKPNILLITTDQQRKDSLGVYNKNPHLKISTPNIDAIAADGITFDRAYIPHPTCTPSRSSILTGQYASVHGSYTIGTALPADCLKLTDILSENGYETYGVGKMHFQPISTEGSFEAPPRVYDEAFWRTFNGPYYGFQHVIMQSSHTSYKQTASMHYRLWLKDRGLTDKAIEQYFDYDYSTRKIGEWKLPIELHPDVFVGENTNKLLQEHAAAKQDKPFFMWASFAGPHDPHVIQEPYLSMYDPDKVSYLGYKEGEHDNRPPIYNQLCKDGYKALSFNDRFSVPSAPPASSVGTQFEGIGTDAYWRKSVAIHHGAVKLIDEQVGTIIETLKQQGLYDNTIIIVTTDHGDYLGNHGFAFKGFPAFEEAYNVPFVVKNAKQANKNIRSEALIGLVDIAPTALRAAGIGIPGKMQGIDQTDVLKGSAKKVRKAFIVENRAVEKNFYQKMLVTDKYKIVMYMDQSYGELYDMETDPDQYANLWDTPACQALKNALLSDLLAQDVLLGRKKRQAPKETIELLKELSAQMHAEEPVLPRTSYS